MATAITTAFEHWNASQVMNGLPARPNKIVFAYIDGLDPTVDIDRTAPLPTSDQIVYQAPVTQYGLINENAVAYSVVLDTLVGDFNFNYLGLVHEESNTLCMVVHTLPQNKIATAAGQQGNSFTRTFLMEFNGAAESSQIAVTAETWQIDYSARLAGIDESIRLSNLDYYGHSAFIGDGFKVVDESNQFRILSGVGYVGGLRVELASDMTINKSSTLSCWLDVALKGTVTGAHISAYEILLADELLDYADSNGVNHYVVKLAVNDNSVIEDIRPSTPLDEMRSELDLHVNSRNHPDATLKDKGFVSLNSSTTSTSQTEAATPKAVKTVYDLAKTCVKSVNEKSGENIVITHSDVGALSAAGGSVTGSISTTNIVARSEVGTGSFSSQLDSQAPFYAGKLNWTPSPGGSYVPIAKGRSERVGQGHPAAVSFGYLLQEPKSFPNPVIHMIADNLECRWDFDSATGDIRTVGTQNFSFATQPWARANFSYKPTAAHWGTNGYLRNSDTGTCMQWGHVSVNSAGNTWVAFPTAFINACFSVAISVNGVSPFPNNYVVYVSDRNHLGFNLYTNGISSLTIDFISIGA